MCLCRPSANDSDGVVQRVEFSSDSGKIGESLAAPFIYVWTNPPAGTHTLTAMAVDDRMGTADSTPVTINVLARPPTVTLNQPADRTVVLAGTSVPLNASVTAGDGGIDRVVFYAGNLLIGQLLAPPYTNVWSSLVIGTFPITAVAVNTLGLAATSSAVIVAFTSGTNTAASLVATGSVWRYLDDGSDQGTNWVSMTFDDNKWRSGPAELGYGDKAEGRPEATEISYGTNVATKGISYYFRRSFTVLDAASFRDLTVNLLRDDGAVVYLNGTEIFRSNMPEGPVNSLTRAINAVAGVEETTYFPNAAAPFLLREGTNVLAVEVHQSSPDSSDVSFDLSLDGSRVLLAPAILAEPVSQRTQAGQTASFTVDAGGTPP